MIGNKDTTKCRYRISFQCSIPSIKYCVSCSYTTGICMFEYGKRWFIILKFTHQCYCCVNIHEIIVGKFFAAEFIKHFAKISKKHGFLVWIFSISYRLLLKYAMLK